MNINWETLERLMFSERMMRLADSRPRAAVLVIRIAMIGLRNHIPDGGIIRDISARIPIGLMVPIGRTRQTVIGSLKEARAAGVLTWEQRFDGRGHVYTVHVD
jgi:hypothetical protein